MGVLATNPGFDWSRVTWGRPDSPPSVLCSYCSAALKEDDVPLMVWNQAGSAAQFCGDCMQRWWGFEPRIAGDRGEESA